MQDTTLLQQALAIAPPWSVIGSTFAPVVRRLDIHNDFAAGSRFACPTCAAAACPAHDIEPMTWRHLNFFQHQAYLHARVPRVRCAACGVKKIGVEAGRIGAVAVVDEDTVADDSNRVRLRTAGECGGEDAEHIAGGGHRRGLRGPPRGQQQRGRRNGAGEAQANRSFRHFWISAADRMPPWRGRRAIGADAP